jgi:hypothetical protein
MVENTSVDQPKVQECKKYNRWAIASFTLGVLGIIPWIYVLVLGFLDPLGLIHTILGLDIFLIIWLIPAALLLGLASIILGGIALSQLREKGNGMKGYPSAIGGISLGILAAILSGTTWILIVDLLVGR